MISRKAGGRQGKQKELGMNALIKALEYVSGKIGEMFDCDECALNDHQANHLHDMEDVVGKALAEKQGMVLIRHKHRHGMDVCVVDISEVPSLEDAEKFCKVECDFEEDRDDEYVEVDNLEIVSGERFREIVGGGEECHECGQKFQIDDNGIANHINDDGEVDHDKDAEHVPFSLEEAAPSKRTMAADEVINAIAETLCRATGEEIEAAAREAGLTGIKYVGDSMFEAE